MPVPLWCLSTTTTKGKSDIAISRLKNFAIAAEAVHDALFDGSSNVEASPPT
jgi:hypothetical protein